MTIGLCKYQSVKVFGTGEVVRAGSFGVAETCFIRYLRTKLFKIGTFSRAEKVRACFSCASDLSKPFAISDFVAMNALFSYNFVNFQFNGEIFSPGNTYFLFFETENYTRVGDTHYVGAIWDNSEAGIYFKLMGETAK